jgi:hypothetical protein
MATKTKKSAAKKASKTTSSNKTSGKKAGKKAAKTSSSKAVKKLAKQADVVDFESAEDFDLDMEDLYSMSEGLTITSPSQPVEYKIVTADSSEELARSVNDLLFVAWDGTVWVPQGGVVFSGTKWAQAVARFE